MKNKLNIILSLLVMLILSGMAYGSNGNWFDKVSQIKLGISTKQEVENLFKDIVIDQTNKFTGSEDVYYKTIEGKLRVSYSLGTCAEVSDKFNLEKEKVLGFSFSPYKPIKVSKLKLDFESFEKRKEDDTANWYYSKPDSEIMYILFKKKRLTFLVASFTETQITQYACGSGVTH